MITARRMISASLRVIRNAVSGDGPGILAMFITPRKLVRAMRAAMPAWLLAVFAACLIIPGPFDEIAMIVVFAALCVIQPIRCRRAMSAWRGGKSHRGTPKPPVVITVRQIAHVTGALITAAGIAVFIG